MSRKLFRRLAVKSKNEHLTDEEYKQLEPLLDISNRQRASNHIEYELTRSQWGIDWVSYYLGTGIPLWIVDLALMGCSDGSLMAVMQKVRNPYIIEAYNTRMTMWRQVCDASRAEFQAAMRQMLGQDIELVWPADAVWSETIVT